MNSLHAIDSPVLLLDRTRLLRNIERMEARAKSLGVALRPHLKTCKSVDVARAIPSASAYGVTVSTVREAEYFARAGFGDQLYAVAIAPSRLGRIAALIRDGARIRLAVDSPDAVTWLAEAGQREAVQFEALVEIDCGEHRSGVRADSPRVIDLATRLAQSAHTSFGGIFTHAGHSYGGADIAAIVRIAEDERRAVVHARERLAAAGLAPRIVSVGSTPTASHAESLDGVTELRAGVYVFGDVFQAAIGSCALDDIAVSVLSTVIGHQPEHGRMLIDAGGLALSKDRSTGSLGGARDCGYGLVCDLATATPVPGLRIADVYQEHGVVESTEPGGLEFDRFPLGSRVRVLPNHACMTCSAYDTYHLVDADRLVGAWPRIHEWRPV